MVTDVNPVLQRRVNEGAWVEVRVEDFWTDTNYRNFAWLAGVRNYAAIVPLDQPRGLPADFAYDEIYWERVGEHDFSWFTLEELLSVDFDQIVEDRRVTGINTHGLRDGGMTCPPGEGCAMKLRDFLGTQFLDDLRRAKDAGADRVVFGFNS